MIDFVLVENVLTCIMLAQFVIGAVFALVYMCASVVDHVYNVKRKRQGWDSSRPR